MAVDAIYTRIVRTTDGPADGMSTDTVAAIPRNGLRQIAASALQSTGDQVVNAKTVLPWLFSALGVPVALVGLLVPIRESGSMLPQAAVLPWVRRQPRRTRVWLIGAAGQALAAASMAVTAAVGEGLAAGVVILVALAVFALSRSLNSLSGKDVLGRTIPKGQRGQINGLATVLSGVAAITVGVGIRVLGGDDIVALAVMLGASALLWVAALAVYAGIREPVDEPESTENDVSWVSQSWSLLRSDAHFRRFVLVRTLLLVSALSPPFVVALAAARGGASFGDLGPFVIASGVASLIGGRWFGRLADRSSRLLMIWGAAAASAVIVIFVLLLQIPGADGWIWVYPVVYLLLTLMHTAVRVARKTYVVDMAEGDRRTEYVAVANTAMGVLLLVVGALSSALALVGNVAALLFLAALGLAGVLMARTLVEVSAG